MDELIIRNFLRPTPFKIKELVQFCGHKYISLRVRLNALRRAGHIMGRTARETDLTRQFFAMGPLEDLPEQPVTSINVGSGTGKKAYDTINARNRERIRAVVSSTTGKHVQPVLTEQKMLAILDGYIAAGAGGKDLVNAVRTRIELGSLGQKPGPPAPLTEDDFVERLLLLMTCAPEPAVTRAYERFVAKDFGTLTRLVAPEQEIPDDDPAPGTEPIHDPEIDPIIAAESAEDGSAD